MLQNSSKLFSNRLIRKQQQPTNNINLYNQALPNLINRNKTISNSN